MQHWRPNLTEGRLRGGGGKNPIHEGWHRIINWDSSRANFLSKARQNSNIFKGFLSKAGQNSNSQTANHTPLQEHAHTSMLALHCSDESKFPQVSKFFLPWHPFFSIFIFIVKNCLLEILRPQASLSLLLLNQGIFPPVPFLALSLELFFFPVTSRLTQVF